MKRLIWSCILHINNIESRYRRFDWCFLVLQICSNHLHSQYKQIGFTSVLVACCCSPPESLVLSVGVPVCEGVASLFGWLMDLNMPIALATMAAGSPTSDGMSTVVLFFAKFPNAEIYCDASCIDTAWSEKQNVSRLSRRIDKVYRQAQVHPWILSGWFSIWLMRLLKGNHIHRDMTPTQRAVSHVNLVALYIPPAHRVTIKTFTIM